MLGQELTEQVVCMTCRKTASIKAHFACKQNVDLSAGVKGQVAHLEALQVKLLAKTRHLLIRADHQMRGGRFCPQTVLHQSATSLKRRIATVPQPTRMVSACKGKVNS